MSRLAAALGAIPWRALGASLLATFFEGFVLARFWGWFVVPSLHLPPLTTGGAVGLLAVAYLLRGSRERLSVRVEVVEDMVPDLSPPVRARDVLDGLATNAAYLVAGWALHLCLGVLP